MPEPLTFQYLLGEPIQFGGRTITPIAKSWRYQVPGGRANLSWNRPSSVLVHQADGGEDVIPIPDITRWVIWSILGACIGAAVFIGIITRFRRRTA